MILKKVKYTSKNKEQYKITDRQINKQKITLRK